MSANLLQTLSDENPDLQKQIGCMAGFFQLFDPHHILSGKRINSHADKRILKGHPDLNENGNGLEPTPYSPRTVSEKHLSKNVNENQRNTNEASKDSSCSSSVSSLNCDKTAQSEPSSSEQTALLDNSPTNPLESKNPDIDSRNNNYALCQKQPRTYSPGRRESLDLRGVVKDSISREARALLIKTMAREEPVDHVLKHRDSPRPLQLSKSVDESHAVGKPKLPSDFNESLRVLEQLKEAPRYFSEVRESPRSSRGTKASKDAPRFSYDGREMPRPSFDSKEIGRATIKAKELPRLSLDSREGSMRSYFNSKSGKSKSPSLCLNPEEDLGSKKRSPSIVEKLMGLEVMPNLSSENKRIVNGEKNGSRFTKISKATKEDKQDRNSRSPKYSFKDPVSPKRRNPDLIMKPISSSRFPIETAPWRQQVRGHSPKKTPLINRDAPHARPQTSPSVYTEIKKKLKEFEFQRSGKDLNALKQIVDAMPAEWLIEKKNEEGQASRFLNRNSPNPVWLDKSPKLANKSNMPNSRLVLSSERSPNTTSSSVSHIVIMKPSKFIDRSSIPASSAIPFDEFSGLPKIQTGLLVGSKSALLKARTEKELSPKLSLKEPVTSNFVSMDKKTNGKSVDNTSLKPRTRSTQISSRPQPLTQEKTGGTSPKNSGSLSPRLQQRKVDQENGSRPPPIPLVELSKPRRKTSSQQSESGSPGGRNRPKRSYALQNDDQSSEISSETRMSSHHDDEISVRSDSNTSMASQVDMEVRSADRPRDLITQLSNQRPSQRAHNNMASSINQKKPLPSFGKDGMSVEVTTAAPEQPSPVSVLDASFYKDDLLPSPVKKMDNSFIDDETWNADAMFGEEGQNLINLDCLYLSRHPDTSSEMNDKKLEKIGWLVQKLRCLKSAHDENLTDHIASLCESMNPDHRYVSEVLLASGLLLKDFSSGRPQIQKHSLGQLINPDLFLALEKTKVSWISTTDPAHQSILCSKAGKEKLHRKLVFDTVNEILIQKLALIDPQHDPWLQLSKPAGAVLSGQQLFKELCSEINRLKPQSLEVFLEDNDDELKSILREDVTCRTESWKDFSKEVSGLVLDIERLIFKDLVDEMVSGEPSSSLPAKQSRRRRQLFSK